AGDVVLLRLHPAARSAAGDRGEAGSEVRRAEVPRRDFGRGALAARLDAQGDPGQSHGVTGAVSRELLERIRRDVLVRLLEPYRLFMAARRIDLDALAVTHQDDHAAIRPLHDLLVSGHPLLPPAPVRALAAIEAVPCH